MILHGDCLEKLMELPDNSIDSVVTDPPYGLSKEPDIIEVLSKWLDGEDYLHRSSGFMGKSWDSFVPGPAIWKEVYRVLKSGGHILCFAGTRTQDLMTISLRLAGFEVRDVIEWLYFSGFPKSMDISKQLDKIAGAKREVIAEGPTVKRMIPGATQDKTGSWIKDNGRTFTYKTTAPATELAKQYDGWGTQLKPSHEPIILCRKPIEKNVAYNVEKYGTGGLNIDGCRIGTETIKTNAKSKGASFTSVGNAQGFNGCAESFHHGRFPANCITLDDDQFYSKYFNITPQELSKKASKKDRNSDWKGEEIALEPKELRTYGTSRNMFGSCPIHHRGLKSGESKYPCGCELALKNETAVKPKVANNHPCVKPVNLMSWCIKLITPAGGIVLDPFAGSGSTLVAAKREGFQYIGIENEAEYIEIINARIS